MEQWLEELRRKYAAPSKKAAPVDRRQFNTPAPKADEDGVQEQCPPCANGEHNFCRGRNCGCLCTRERRAS